jgi:hypothetical protein
MTTETQVEVMDALQTKLGLNRDEAALIMLAISAYAPPARQAETYTNAIEMIASNAR